MVRAWIMANDDGAAGTSASKKKRKPSDAKLLSASDGSAKMSATEKKRLERYSRGPGNKSKGVVKHRLKLGIKRSEKKINEAAKKAAQSEMLLPTEKGVLEAEHEMERTARMSQREVTQAVDLQTQRKAYDMKLDKFGPYKAHFTANGRHVLLGGRKGHLAVLDWQTARIQSEIYVKETVRDATFLRDHTMFAVAQHKNLYIYDQNGTELHCLRHHKPQVNRIAFLRYHWLLSTVSSSGHLRYLDVSTGTNVADFHTRLGDCDCMRVNSWNAVVHLGHSNGVVTMCARPRRMRAAHIHTHAHICARAHICTRTHIRTRRHPHECTSTAPQIPPPPRGGLRVCRWTPSMNEPVVKMLCHKGAVASLAIDRSGRYMATSGRDGSLKVWDIRTYKPMHEYRTPRIATSIDISDTGLLAAVHGPSVQIFKDCLTSRANGPYMTHLLPGKVAESCRFAPYEDFLGVGHSGGYCSMLVPGSGEPNFDSFEANPYEGAKQRKEGEVASLLEKLPPDTISLDPQFINTVDRNQKERQKEHTQQKEERLAELKANKRVKKKTRGRSKIGRKLAKKQGNIIDEKREARKAELEEQRRKVRQRAGPEQGFDPLARFRNTMVEQ